MALEPRPKIIVFCVFLSVGHLLWVYQYQRLTIHSAATSSYMELLRKNFSPAHMKQPLPEFNVAATERENDEEADQDPDVVNVVEGDD